MENSVSYARTLACMARLYLLPEYVSRFLSRSGRSFEVSTLPLSCPEDDTLGFDQPRSEKC